MRKYKSKKCYCAAHCLHDSKKEARRCDVLHLLEKMGKISELKTQQKFELIPAQKFDNSIMENERSCSYIADFTYFKDGVFVIEDAKGYKTPDYVIKRKLMKQKYCAGKNVIFVET